ncbi:MAG: TIGR04084 family radical SAM/SPASM domain-containing protein [Thermoplasmata archaeon]
MENVLFLITTTGKCNLRCDYCGGSFDPALVPYNVKYDIKKLIEFLNRFEKKTVVFYGGEPLLNFKFIEEFFKYDIGKVRTGIQTNGTLIRNFNEEFWKNFDFALLSIDGNRDITDIHRGSGVYDKVISGAEYLKSMNIETIARMAISHDNDIFRSVNHLINTGLFDKIHWQLDVIWDIPWDVKSWADKSYLPGIDKLLDIFIENIEKNRILKIVPFLGILNSYYFSKFEHVPCGAGKRSFTINSDGRILACPIAVNEHWSILGNLNGLFSEFSEKLECHRCDYFPYCGGRCLYAYKERFWGEEGFRNICYITQKTVDSVLSRADSIKKILERNNMKIEDLKYDPTEDSTEIIP